jgi:hypothetical protein
MVTEYVPLANAFVVIEVLNLGELNLISALDIGMLALAVSVYESVPDTVTFCGMLRVTFTTESTIGLTLNEALTSNPAGAR